MIFMRDTATILIRSLTGSRSCGRASYVAFYGNSERQWCTRAARWYWSRKRKILARVSDVAIWLARPVRVHC